MQYCFLAAYYQRMSGIMAALKTHYGFRLFG